MEEGIATVQSNETKLVHALRFQQVIILQCVCFLQNQRNLLFLQIILK